MTEPEELDEDLFADLCVLLDPNAIIRSIVMDGTNDPRYDADETSPKPQSGEPIPPVAEPVHEISNGQVDDTKYSMIEEAPNINLNAEETYDNNRTENQVSEYGNHEMFDGQANHFQSGDMESEHHNIGIKEDG